MSGRRDEGGTGTEGAGGGDCGAKGSVSRKGGVATTGSAGKGTRGESEVVEEEAEDGEERQVEADEDGDKSWSGEEKAQHCTGPGGSGRRRGRDGGKDVRSGNNEGTLSEGVVEGQGEGVDDHGQLHGSQCFLRLGLGGGRRIGRGGWDG